MVNGVGDENRYSHNFCMGVLYFIYLHIYLFIYIYKYILETFRNVGFSHVFNNEWYFNYNCVHDGIHASWLHYKSDSFLIILSSINVAHSAFGDLKLGKMNHGFARKIMMEKRNKTQGDINQGLFSCWSWCWRDNLQRFQENEKIPNYSKELPILGSFH